MFIVFTVPNKTWDNIKNELQEDLDQEPLNDEIAKYICEKYLRFAYFGWLVTNTTEQGVPLKTFFSAL